VLLEDVDAAVVADRVGDPGADDVREHADATTANSEYSPSETLKPANSIVASDGIGMHALSATISAKIPGRPSLSTTSTANWTAVGDRGLRRARERG
jgi:hypothetical protein